MVIKTEEHKELCFEEISDKELFRDALNPSCVYYKTKVLYAGDRLYNAVNLSTGEIDFFDAVDGVYEIDGCLTTKN